MSNKTKTPPAVSDDQYGKVEQVFRDIVRKGNIVGPELQHVLGHPDFVKELSTIVNSKVAEYRQKLPLVERPSWKTIELCTCNSPNALRKELIDAGFRIGEWGDDILKRIKVVGKKVSLDLYLFTVGELCGKNSPWKDIWAKLDELGFAKVPAETGAELRKQYPDQPVGEWVWIVMEPITDSDGILGVFDVGCDSVGRWLSGFYGHLGLVLLADFLVVCCRKDQLLELGLL